MPHFSIIIVSHNKPQLVRQAVQGVLDQTHGNWEAVLVDSGVLLNQGFFSYLSDSRVRIIASGETPEMGRTTNMASWCFNQVLNSGQVTGELIMYLCDDDLIYPEAFETYWNFYVQNDRVPQAMYASQHIGLVQRDGTTKIMGTRTADRPAGRFCNGRKLDCHVDGLQFCHTAKVLERFREAYKTNLYHEEDKNEAYHADGIFMEQIGALTKIYNINKVLSMNRRTVDSANLEYSESALGRGLIWMKSKWAGARRRLTNRR